ncbi:hypothetical protein G6O67_000969 [Ophiocordyceps sinensis]|uniref:Metalloprotease MEP1 n=1 Tax=Ophiocordyceps sinensis TaxID=72228 RepID=A0A8H4V8D5_9HYPO|nr:hypothetical protein G6O67_000969 [Ophiocordyceps sinensis]
MLPIFMAGLMAAASMASPIDPEEEGGYSTCGNSDPSPEESKLWARQLGQNDNNEELTMKVSFSFCCPSQGECEFDAVAKGNEELRIMNECYSACNIKWTLLNSTKITDDVRCRTTSLDRNKDQLEGLKLKSRDGGSEVCNVLYLPSNQAAGKKGECIAPKPGSPAPPKNLGFVDSCVVAMNTLPGVKGATTGGARQQESPPRPAAKTATCPVGADITTVHECGHFLSLQHVGGDKLRRRQRGGSGNVMDAVQHVGSTYRFDPSQCPTMRLMAKKRLRKGNSTDGTENRGGEESSPRVAGFPNDRTGGPDTPEGPFTPSGPFTPNGPLTPKGPFTPNRPFTPNGPLTRNKGTPENDFPGDSANPTTPQPGPRPQGGPKTQQGPQPPRTQSMPKIQENPPTISPPGGPGGSDVDVQTVSVEDPDSFIEGMLEKQGI